MRCNRVHAWISLESDGQLAPDRVPHLEAHLQACAACRDYRAELLLGRRLLRATATGPAEGFEWRLQMRLNNALKESARIAAAPWPGEDAGWRRWFGHFGVSASMGLAAVLAGALLLSPGPQDALRRTVAADDGLGRRVPVETASPAKPATSTDSSRRSLTQPLLGGSLESLQRSVSLTDGIGGQTWSPHREATILQVQHLAQENEVLRRRLAAAEYRSQKLQARVDSLARLAR